MHHMAQYLLNASGVVLFITLAVNSASSQIVIERQDVLKIFTPGESHYYTEGTGGNFDVGRKGGPNVYDFSGISLATLSTSYNYDVSTIPELAGRFSNGGVTMGDSPSTIEKNPVFLFGPDTMFTLGHASLIPTLSTVHYVPPEIVMISPAVYGSEITQDVQKYDSTFDAGGHVTSTDFSSSQEYTVVDGYGLLKLSGMQFECIRVRKEHRGYGDKEFLYLTKEGAFVGVGGIALTDPDTGVVSGGAQVLLAAPLVSVSQKEEIPQVYALEQNYPNPFNPETRLVFSLPGEGSVTLDIYDVLGRTVARLAEGLYPAGTHSVAWTPGGSVSSGVYFVRLTVQSGSGKRDFVATRKVMLQK
jgi:hypothetical protein